MRATASALRIVALAACAGAAFAAAPDPQLSNAPFTLVSAGATRAAAPTSFTFTTSSDTARRAARTETEARARITASAAASASGDRRVITHGESEQDIRVEIKDGEVVVATINGEPVDPARISRAEGGAMSIAGAGGQAFYVAGGQGGALTLAQAGPAPAARPRIGVSMGAVDEALAAQLGLDAGKVFLVTDVMDGLPASRAGLRRFDIVTHIDGEAPATGERLRNVVVAKEAGDQLKLRVVRKGEPREIVIKVEKSDAPAGRAGELRERELEQIRGRLAPAAPGAQGEGGARLRRSEDTERAARAELEAMQQRLHTMRERVEAETVRDLAAQLRERFRDEATKGQLSMDAETWKKIEKAMEEAARSLEGANYNFRFSLPEIEILRDEEGKRRALILPTPPTPPAPPSPPSARSAPAAPGVPGMRSWSPERFALPGAIGRNPELDDRLKGLEERMERLEALLKRLVEKAE